MGIINFFRRFFTSEEGKLFVLKELIAYLYLKFLFNGIHSRFKLYHPLSQTDVRKVNVLIPTEEELIEHRRFEITETIASDCLLIFGSNAKHQKLVAKISLLGNDAIVWLQLQLNELDQYVLPLPKRTFRIPKVGEDCFAGGGLRLRCLVPMRKWRISYNGILRNCNPSSQQDVHVQFSFIWTASSMPFDASTDIPLSLQSNYLAKQRWDSCLPSLSKCYKIVDAYEQSGYMLGTVTIDREESEKIILWGARVRSAEPVDVDSSLTFTKDYFCYMTEGDYFHISEHHFAGESNPYRFGYVVHSNTFDYKMDVIKILENEDGGVDGEFERNKKTIKFHLCSSKNTFEFENQDFAGQKLSMEFVDVEMNGETGKTIIFKTINNGLPGKYSKISTNSNTTKAQKSLIVDLCDYGCKNVNQTGGKGSSLAELTDISKKDQSFQVPKGVVVSIFAYESFVKENSIQNILKENQLEEIVYGKTSGDAQEVCKKTVTEVAKAKLPSGIETELVKKLQTIFKSDFETVLFAIRSSAAGEDSEDMSTAGQMDTFLGVKGVKQISEAIVKCWASQFSHTAIQYKRQNGQELNSPMAVVVQEMVLADQAGVMFTCDPLTGNPALITITANYGLGESVVSATAEPDTIVIERNIRGEAKLKTVEVGRKSTKTILSENGGTLEAEVSNSDSLECCLSIDNAIKLAELGHRIEELYGCPLDIEWALKGTDIYLLQARPVTTFDKETETEIIHEHDSVLRCHNDCVTKANVGEVMPGATTEFGFQFMMKLMDLSVQNHWIRQDEKTFPYNPYVQKGLVTFRKHVFFAMIDTLLRFEGQDSPKSAITNAYEIALFGRTLNDDELRQQGARRNKNYPSANANKLIFYIIRDNLLSNRRLKAAVKAVTEYKLIVDDNLKAREYFEKLLLRIFDINDHGGRHSECTFYSTMFSLALLSVLAKGNDDKFDEVIYADFATLLSSCKQVESADVPSSMKELAIAINNSIETNTFKKMSTQEALFWLENSDTEAKKKFHDFLQKHGHRCVKEFDVYTKPWGVNPLSLVKTLQEMVGHTSNDDKIKEQSSTSEMLKQLKIPLNWKRKMILKFLVPFCQSAVGKRETSKSVMIKIVDHFRQKFTILASKMVEEGIIPEKDLFYFLSLYEVSVLLKMRSSKIIQKAIRRKNIHSELDANRYPEIIKGLPIPNNLKSTPTYTEGALLLKGTPVSRGVVTGPVRVATTLEEASHIQRGEILIAYSTDIGWSPYFPMLAGVATELGGLISHGAVVAREYGLPCVVALHGATMMFKTGDIVLLDGNKGVIQRIDS